MKLLHIAVISLCLVEINSYFVRKSSKGKRLKEGHYKYNKHLQATTTKSRMSLLNVEFCNKMHTMKLDPSEDLGMPWWYDPCERILKEDYLLKQKTKYFEPVRRYILKMKNHKDLDDKIKEMMLSMDNYHIKDSKIL